MEATELFLNPQVLKRPDSHDSGLDLIEFRNPVFGILLKRAGSPPDRLWSTELPESSRG
jgi:hypothetical protein